MLTDAYGSKFTDLSNGDGADQQKQVGLLAAGGLLRLMREWMRNNPDGGTR
jgi:hypothetical protein